jgi:hypothetical protein
MALPDTLPVPSMASAACAAARLAWADCRSDCVARRRDSAIRPSANSFSSRAALLAASSDFSRAWVKAFCASASPGIDSVTSGAPRLTLSPACTWSWVTSPAPAAATTLMLAGGSVTRAG